MIDNSSINVLGYFSIWQRRNKMLNRSSATEFVTDILYIQQGWKVKRLNDIIKTSLEVWMILDSRNELEERYQILRIEAEF